MHIGIYEIDKYCEFNINLPIYRMGNCLDRTHLNWGPKYSVTSNFILNYIFLHYSLVTVQFQLFKYSNVNIKLLNITCTLKFPISHLFYILFKWVAKRWQKKKEGWYNLWKHLFLAFNLNIYTNTFWFGFTLNSKPSILHSSSSTLHHPLLILNILFFTLFPSSFSPTVEVGVWQGRNPSCSSVKNRSVPVFRWGVIGWNLQGYWLKLVGSESPTLEPF